MTKFKLFVFTDQWKLVGTFNTSNQASVFKDIYYKDAEKWSISRDVKNSNCSCDDKEYHDINCVRYKDWS